MSDKKIVEINGVKMEIDLRYAREIDTYRIGDNVKVLVKGYSDSYASHPGVITGFDNFKERPAILVTYLDMKYSESNLVTVSITKDSKEIELCPMVDDILFEKEQVLVLFDRKIAAKEAELQDVKRAKNYFELHFAHYWEQDKEK
jgi:hypothetical protein